MDLGGGIYGVQTLNTTLACDHTEIYNRKVTPVSIHSIYIADNSNVNFKNVYTEWAEGTDSTRYFTKAGDATAVFNFNEYRYKNGSNVVKMLKDKSSGTTANRPTSDLYIGRPYYDSTLGKPIWWAGTVWKDSAGTTV